MIQRDRAMQLGATFKLLVFLNFICLIALGGAFFYQDRAQANAEAAYRAQYQSYLLADEMRQSSDDLTRLVRTYAATGDAKYEKWYFDVIAMRNGEAARPVEPHRIYWDLVLEDGKFPRPAGEKKPLLDAMIEAGFTSQELDLLAEAKKRSDALVQLEVRSMDAVKGKGMPNGLPDRKLANDLLYSQDYHQAKAAVMEPVDKFFETIEHRTAGQISTEKAAVTMANVIMMVTGGLLAVLITATAVILQRRIMTPIAKLRDCMTALSDGELSTEVPMADRKDEVGSMAKALLVFKTAVSGMQSAEESEKTRQEFERERAENDRQKARAAAEDNTAIDNLTTALAALADGDLTYRIEAEFAPKTQKLKDDFNRTAEELHSAFLSIMSGIQGVRSSTTDISHAADDLSKRTERHAASLEEAAAALDEITATVKTSAKGAKQASDIVEQTRSTADRSGGVMRQAVAAIAQIEKSSEEIGQIIGVIEEIAFQTNLLALNAGVEAARAGEEGRGFAVVASEVRALAQRSADAAKQVKGLITTSASHVGHGVDLVGATEASLNEIVSQVAQVTTLISEIAKSSTEQSVALTEVNTAINDMDRVTQENAVMVEQSTTATHAMARQTADLDQLVARFRVGDRARRSRPAHQNDARSAPRSQAVNREVEAEVAGWNATGRMARHG